MTENLIEHELGCGSFQIVVVILIYWLPMIPVYCSVQMMSFGSYNPGWTCVDKLEYGSNDDNRNTSHTNITNRYEITTSIENINLTQEDIGLKYEEFNLQTNRDSPFVGYGNTSKGHSCNIYKECSQVGFNPTTSTIVTEWGLICDQAHIPPLIISVQMCGVFVGALFSGHLIDIMGRKKSFFSCLFSVALINCLSVFSISWQMFTVLRFLQGVFCASLMSVNYVYSSEFITRKWRAPLSGSPIWGVSGICNGIIAMLLKDWKHFLSLTSLMCVICCLPVVWIPESLRWLEAKNKFEKFREVFVKIASMNGKDSSRIDSTDFVKKETIEKKYSGKNKKFLFMQLFQRGYKGYSITVAIQWFSLSVIITSISFGVKALGGNFYINLITMNLMSIVFAIFPVVAPNIIGRKKAVLTCFSLITVSLLAATSMDLLLPKGNAKDIGTLIAVMGVIAGVESGRSILVLLITEIYPTVVRGLGVSWGNMVSRVGAIIAPFLIPTDSDYVYIWYSIMGLLGFLCCCLVRWLPETKGKPMKETFLESEKSENIQIVYENV